MQGATAESSLIGQAFDNKYRILRLVGRGGMGEVFEAEHTTLGKRVAIKLMLEKYTGDGEAVARFTREALAASRIGNPHIIEVIDISTAPDGRSYVVMELLTGMPLGQLLEQQGTLPPQRALNIMRQVLRAVGAAHAKGIVHRDLKPDNIFLVDQGEHPDFVKLLDFGISKMIDPDLQVAATRLTTTGVVMGTPLYMAPEQAMGADIDHLADLYACGAILYEMLSGRPPFEGHTYAVLVAKLLTTDPPLLSDLRPGLSPKLVAAVHRALEKEPNNRFASAEAFAAALPQNQSASAVELAGTIQSGKVLAVPRPGASKSRRWPLLAASLAMLAGIGTATVILMAQTRETAPTTPTPAPTKEPTVSPISPAAPAVEESGVLQITSDPKGAAVMMGGKLRGVTPVNVTLTPGEHRVRLELDGYQPDDSVQVITANSRTFSKIVLKPAPVANTRTDKAKAGTKTSKPAVGFTGTSDKAPAVTPIKKTEAADEKVTEKTVERPPPPPPVKDPPEKKTPVVQPGTKPNPY